MASEFQLMIPFAPNGTGIFCLPIYNKSKTNVGKYSSPMEVFGDEERLFLLIFFCSANALIFSVVILTQSAGQKVIISAMDL